MSKLNEILKQYLAEQIGLEEHLCKVIEEQISEISETDFSETDFGYAKNLLVSTREVLEKHFIPLNELLDKLEYNIVPPSLSNGIENKIQPNGSAQEKKRISTILRDNYSALNLITMSNTLLHTVALALDSQEVAEIALNHLKNLAPLVKQIGKILPETVARELNHESAIIDLTVAQLALNNIRLAWES